jgi:periplasmic protein TonB
MKAMRLVLNLVLALSFIAIPSRAQDTPQQDNSPPQPAKKITRVKQGGAVMVKMLKVKIEPVYPPLAKDKGIQGTVRLHAIVGRDGAMQQIEVISGQPLLVQAALDAVRQWKYRITYLNGEPVEVDTTIDINFSLNR